VRIISATHQNLEACVSAGKFRQDLYYRLNVIELHLPPLRERLGDIAVLSDAILQRLGSAEYPVSLQASALQALSEYDFPGNVRELENILERAVAFANDGSIEVTDLALRNNGRNSGRSKAAAVNETAKLETSEVVDLTQILAQPPPLMADLVALEEENLFSAPELPCCLPEYLEKIERELIRRALLKTHDNRTQAAELLGVSFRQLRYQIQKLKINDAG
jgi:two-component system response regulator PilR (NtrC family)